MSAASSQLEQLAINAQVQQKRRELVKLDDRLALDGYKVRKIQDAKRDLVPQQEEDYGVGLLPEEKAEQKKQGP